MVPWGKDTPPCGFFREIYSLPGGKNPHHPRGHFLKTRFLYKKIHAQQSAPKPPYVGRMNVGRGDRGEDSPGRATRCHAGYHRCPKCATTGNLSGNSLIFVL